MSENEKYKATTTTTTTTRKKKKKEAQWKGEEVSARA